MRYLFELIVLPRTDESCDAYDVRKNKLLKKIITAFACDEPEEAEQGVRFRTEEFRLGFRLLEWAERNGIADRWLTEKSMWDLSSLFHARYVPLVIDSHCVDVDRSGMTLNSYPKSLCHDCGWYDESVVEAPYKVVGSLLRATNEVYEACHGRVVVTSRVLELLRRAVEMEIEWQPVAVMGKTAKGVEQDLVCVRPKQETGPNPGVKLEESCGSCGVPLACPLCPKGGRFGSRILVERFGQKGTNIARLGHWCGGRDSPAENLTIGRKTLVSGGLLAYLLANEVKGLMIPDAGVFSMRESEPPIEKRRRLANLVSDDALESLIRKLKRKKRFEQ